MKSEYEIAYTKAICLPDSAVCFLQLKAYSFNEAWKHSIDKRANA